MLRARRRALRVRAAAAVARDRASSSTSRCRWWSSSPQQPPTGMVVLACRDQRHQLRQSGSAASRTSRDRAWSCSSCRCRVLRLPRGARASDALPALWYFTKPLTAAGGQGPARGLGRLGRSGWPRSPASRSTQAGKGLVILEAFDCSGEAVGGMSLRGEQGRRSALLHRRWLPNTREHGHRARRGSNNLAIGGFLNATPGFTHLLGQLGLDGPLLGTSTRTCARSTVTYVDIHP